jgi:hypothetical protein
MRAGRPALSNQSLGRGFSPHKPNKLKERAMSSTKICLAAASLALPLLSAGAGVAMPSAATGMRAAVESIDTVESVQYVWGGRRYCWSNRGWHGPGWYRCGMELSYGYGWGGPLGWHGWREGRGEFRTGRGDFRREGRGEFRREGRGDVRREGGDFRRDGDARGRTSSGGGSTRGTSGVGQGEPRAGTSGGGGAGVRSGGGGDGNTGASGGVGGAGGAGGGGSPGGGGAPAVTPGPRQ